MVPTFFLSPLIFFFPSCPHPRNLHSFPTRRSSDLESRIPIPGGGIPFLPSPAEGGVGTTFPEFGIRDSRSEEHTSELQSRLQLVCRLLLEKKKKTTYRGGRAPPQARKRAARRRASR